MEEKYQNFFKTAKDCIFITSKDGKWLDMSDSAPGFFGYENKEELKKVKVPDLYENAAYRKKHTKQIEEKGFTKEYPVNLKKKDGFILNTLITSVPVKDDNGEVIGYQGTIRDITEQTAAQSKLKESQKHLHELNSTKDKFFSILGHDLRSPFNSIIGFSELLTNEADSFNKDEIKEMAESMYKTSKETYGLLNNLLEWSRSQTGNMKFNPAKIKIYDIAESAIDLLNDNAKRKKIEVSVDIPEQTTVFADENMIKTVIRNLLSNAIKFTHEKGSIKISAKDKDDCVDITVSDTGVGMEPDDINKLFHINEIISTQGASEEKGTGLGLVLCHDFVKKNNGDIHVESTVDKGSRFTVSLPGEGGRSKN